MKPVTRSPRLFKSVPGFRSYLKAARQQRWDARSYRKYLVSQVQKSRTSNNLGKRSRDFLASERIPSIFPKKKRFKEVNEKPAANGKNRGVCTVCKLQGELLCYGRGCNRGYHLCCIDPPFIEAPPGIWHCVWCVQKKMELGVQSVSRGPESIWDSREAMSNHKEVQHKEYLVKFRGLAHVHNQWVPETKLLAEAPLLIDKFQRKIKLNGWRQHWMVPQRLLQKRLLSLAGQSGDTSQEHESRNFSCQYEWLVKWRGLGYDQATWELENAPFLTSSAAMKLIGDYETRHSEAEGSSRPPQGMEARLFELSEHLSSSHGRDYSSHLSYVKRLFESWSKGCSSFVIGNKIPQERVMRVVLFLLSLPPTLSRPVLIVTSLHALSVWEDELLHMAPFSNFVVYKGNKDLRSSIRFLEFYNESGGTKFDILLSTLITVVEDFEVLRCIGWNITVVDECQCSSVLSQIAYLKKLSAHMRLLISSDEIKDSSSDYLNVLSLLNPKFGKSGPGDDGCALDIEKYKEELSAYLVYECKLNPVKFVEYWVPVHISNVQLEQYGDLLLSNLATICSGSRNGSVVTLREIILETRKICDHPLLLDRSLLQRIREGLPTEGYFNAEVEMSGKLLFLDRILKEMSQRGLRALIIFQTIEGSGLVCTGNILEDYVRQRFGDGCYVRIDGADRDYAPSKKRAAIDMFNDKQNGKFIFLIEKRSCLSSIKLFSVDSVILFNSSWDPESDLTALLKISISSQFEQIKIFRLYSCHTVEEKLLILAKEGVPIENGIKFMSRKTCHTLLHWGAAHLFSKLDEFHGRQTSESSRKIYSDSSCVDAVFSELASVLVGNKRLDDNRCKFMLEMQQNNGAYDKNAFLQGEKGTLICDTAPFDFWKTLNENRYPKWHFISESASMIRRKSQFVDTRATRQQVLENQVNRVETLSEGKANENYAAANKDHIVTGTQFVDTRAARQRLLENQETREETKSEAKSKKKYVSANRDHVVTDTRKSQFVDTRAASQRGLKNQVNREETESEAKAMRNSVAANKDHIVTERDQELDLEYSSDCHPAVDHSSGVQETDRMELSESDKLASPEDRLSSLNLNLMKLCSVLKLPRDVEDTAVAFLMFLQDEYEVDWESDDTSEAFQISLCWTAAYMLNHKINHKESLRLAKEHLEFDCEATEANYIYHHRLRDAKRAFVKSKKDLNDMKSSRLSSLDDTDLGEQVLVASDGGRSSRPDHQNADGKDTFTGLPVQNLAAEVVRRSEAGLPNHAENFKSTILDQECFEGNEIPVDYPVQTPQGHCVDQHIEDDGSVVSDTVGKQKLKEREIAITLQAENVVNPCVNQDLEEGEIPPCTNVERAIPTDYRTKLDPGLEGEIQTHTQLENLVNPYCVYQDLEEGEIPPACVEERQIAIEYQTELAPGLEGEVLAYSQPDMKTVAIPSQSPGNDVSSGKRVVRDLDRAELPPVNSEQHTTSALKRVQHSVEGGIRIVLRRKVCSDESETQETLQAQNVLEHQVSAHFEEMPTSLVLERNSDEGMDEAKVREDHRIETMQLRPDKGTGALLDERFRISSPSKSELVVIIDSDSDTEEVEATDPKKALATSSNHPNDVAATLNSCDGRSYPESDSGRQNLLVNATTVNLGENENLPEAAQVRSPRVIVIDEMTENPVQGMPNQVKSMTSPGPSISNQAVASTYGTQVPGRESGVGDGPSSVSNYGGNELSQDTHPPLINPIAAAAAGSCSCPLQYEMEKLQNEQEHASKTYEYVVARIRADHDKLIEDVNKSHNLLFHLLEGKLRQGMKERGAKLSKIKAASVVAEVLRKAETGSPPDKVQSFSPREAAPVIDPPVQHLQTTLSAADVRHYQPSVPAAPVRPSNDRMTHFPGQLHNESPLVGGSHHYPWGNAAVNMYQTRPTVPRLQNTMWLPFVSPPPPPPPPPTLISGAASQRYPWGNADVNNAYPARPTDPRLQNTALFPFPLSPPPSTYASAVQPYQQPLSMTGFENSRRSTYPKPGSSK